MMLNINLRQDYLFFDSVVNNVFHTKLIFVHYFLQVTKDVMT